MSPVTCIIFGASGSGKGTQANLLIDYLKKINEKRPTLYIETGQKFRDLAVGESFTAKRIREMMNTGALLPEFLPIWMWTETLVRNVTGDENIILEGVSRREHEAPILDSAMRFYERENPFVISIEVSKEWATARLVSRKRYDDTPADIAERLSWYDKNVIPAIEYYKNNPYYRFISINGVQEVEAVHKDIIAQLKI